MRRIEDTLYDILDVNTGEYITYSKIEKDYFKNPINDSLCDGVILRKLGDEYFKRNDVYKIYATWFDVKADGVTDDTVALQKAINACLSNINRAVELVLPTGVMVVTDSIKIGTDTGPLGHQTSFVLTGQGFSSTNLVSGSGTVIMYKGPSGPNTKIIEHLPSSGRFDKYRNLQIMAETADGVEVGINFKTSSHSAFDFEFVRIINASTSMKQNKGTGLNAEFINFYRCKFERFSKDGYYHDAQQALSNKWIGCSFLANPGSTCFNFEQTAGGTWLGFDVTYLAGLGATPNTFMKVGGTGGDSLEFIGGRWEGIDTLTYAYSTLSYNASFHFDGITVAIPKRVTPWDSIDLSQAQSASSARISTNNCNFYISDSTKGYQQKWNINLGNAGINTKASGFYAEKTTWTQIKVTYSIFREYLLQPGLASNQSLSVASIEIKNCIQRMVSGTAIQAIPFELKVFNNGKPELDSRKQENLLLQSKYTNINGNNIIALPPWVHFGTTTNFINTSDLISSSVSNTKYSDAWKRIAIGPLSGVYQDVSAIDISTNWSKIVYYKAYVELKSNATMKFSLVNSIDPTIVYDTITIGSASGSASNRLHNVELKAFIPSAGTGLLRLVQENISTTGNLTFNIRQHLYQDINATFVTTTDTAINKNYNWDIIEEDIKITNRLQIPFKDDSYGKSLGALPDVQAELYLSSNNLSEYIFTDRWEVRPRQDIGIAIPTTGTWPKGFIRFNTNYNGTNPFGWQCSTAGSPGTWTPIAAPSTGWTYRSFDANANINQVNTSDIYDFVGTAAATINIYGGTATVSGVLKIIKNSSAFNLTVNPGSSPVDGSTATFIIPPNGSLMIVSSGIDQWKTLFNPRDVNQDIEVTDATKGVILRSPNGTRYRLTINNTGNIVATAI